MSWENFVTILSFEAVCTSWSTMMVVWEGVSKNSRTKDQGSRTKNLGTPEILQTPQHLCIVCLYYIRTWWLLSSILISTLSLLQSIYIYIKNLAWEDQSEKVFCKCHIYASVLYCVVIEHPSVLYWYEFLSTKRLVANHTSPFNHLFTIF